LLSLFSPCSSSFSSPTVSARIAASSVSSWSAPNTLA
jgi:hypothetical protein